MVPRIFVVAVIGLACMVDAPVRAQAIEPGEERQIAALLPPNPGASICFARHYDSAHLQKHPRQQVRSIAFRLAYYRHDPDAYFPKGQRNYYFELRARLRNGPEMRSGGECAPGSDGTNIACMVECDGGGVLVRKTAGPGQLLVDLEATGRIRMSLGCGEGDGVDLEPGLDDKRFLLTQLPADRCPGYEQW